MGPGGPDPEAARDELLGAITGALMPPQPDPEMKKDTCTGDPEARLAMISRMVKQSKGTMPPSE